MSTPKRHAAVRIDDQLQLIVPGGRTQLTPRGALDLAERLARQGFRKMLAEEAASLECSSDRAQANSDGDA